MQCTSISVMNCIRQQCLPSSLSFAFEFITFSVPSLWITIAIVLSSLYCVCISLKLLVLFQLWGELIQTRTACWFSTKSVLLFCCCLIWNTPDLMSNQMKFQCCRFEHIWIIIGRFCWQFQICSICENQQTELSFEKTAQRAIILRNPYIEL